jgi:N-acyl-D-amino-acid deacylase
LRGAPSPGVSPFSVTTRRSFLAALGSSVPALVWAPHVRWSRPPYDLVIRGGTVFDGTGMAGIQADVAIAAGRIVSIERRVTGAATTEIDARGLAVAPGFIDIHSHADGTLRADPRAESVVRQGVTTVVVGQDGSSSAPVVRPNASDPAEDGRQFPTFAAFIQSVDALRPAVNVASMVGLGTIRGTVVGDANRPATSDELRRMTALVEQALADGACGASSGLEYTPGAFASRDELIALCRPLAARRLPYATHMRNEDDQLLEAIDESIAVARGARCPLQISHLKTQGPRNWKKLDDVFARVDVARQAGLDVAFDRYPYIAYQTGLTNLFPVWSRDGSTDAFLARLDDPAVAPRIKTETLAKVDLIGGWDNVLVSGVRAAEDRGAEGQRLGAWAKSLGADPYVVAVAMLKRNRANIGMVGFAMSEENLERILAHPLGMVCSDGGAFALDGPARRGHPHPRGLGTFPRVLGRYVRERKSLSLEQAIHKMSGLPASRIALRDRGQLKAGFAADVVVFDPATIADRATFDAPFQYPVGISTVVVNGTVALRDGTRASALSGRVLRPSA